MNLRNKIKQYGYYNSIKRLIKSIMRVFGVDLESFVYLSCDLNIGEINSQMRKYSYDDVIELAYINYENSDPKIFNKNKLKLIKKRLESGKYWSYGILHNNKIIYSCWITTLKIRFPQKYEKEILLKNNEGFLEDAYCDVGFRGQGLHSKMNLFRLMNLFKKGRDKSIVLIVSENYPALKSQMRIGFKKKRKIIFLRIFTKEYYFEKNCK